MAKDCFVFIEESTKIKDISLQLLSEAQRIKEAFPKHIDRVVAVYPTNSDHDLSKLHAFGADQIIRIKEDAFETYNTVVYASAIAEVVEAYKPTIFLIGGSIIGRDLAPRISAKLQTGLTADTTHLSIDDETGLFLMTRPAFGGNINATIICDSKTPQMATVRESVFEVERFNLPEKPIIDFKLKDIKKTKIEVIKSTPKPKQARSITDARIIVAGGRGVSDQFEVIGKLAKELDGEVGASRAVVDQKIVPKDIQVGQTGTTVRPVIYIASGISGAIQHTAGMDKSELIIALNTDPNAAIFDVADIGLVVDAKKVLPLLLNRLESNKRKDRVN